MAAMPVPPARPRIALLIGDRYGVGPEIAARRLAAIDHLPDVEIVVFGDRRVLARGAASCGIVLDIAEIDSFTAPMAGTWALLDHPTDIDVEPIGRVSTDAGAESLILLRLAAEAGQAGEIDGIVFAPLNKQAMRQAGHSAGDELEYLAAFMPPAGPYGDVNILGSLWTSRVTSHIPLGSVAASLTPHSLDSAIALLDGAMRRGGHVRPRLAMSALNPHAGEGGAYGREEIELLAPAVARAREAGIDINGPFPSDTIFPRALAGQFEGIVTMFHDQGQIALKAIGLGQGITLLAGLTVPVATPAHGTAYDIAGTGKARDDGLRAALDLVASMASSLEN